MKFSCFRLLVFWLFSVLSRRVLVLFPVCVLRTPWLFSPVDFFTFVPLPQFLVCNKSSVYNINSWVRCCQCQIIYYLSLHAALPAPCNRLFSLLLVGFWVFWMTFLFLLLSVFFIQAAIKAPLLLAPVLSSTLHATKKAKYQFPPCNVIIFASFVVHLKKQMFNLLPGSHQVISQQNAQSHFLPTSGDTLQHISFVHTCYSNWFAQLTVAVLCKPLCNPPSA